MNLKNEMLQEEPTKNHLLKSSISRREFLFAGTGLAAFGAVVLSSCRKVAEVSDIEKLGTKRGEASFQGEIRNFNPDMLYRRLGRTNLMVSAVSFGGAFHYGPGALKEATEIQRIFDKSLELGINYGEISSRYSKLGKVRRFDR